MHLTTRVRRQLAFFAAITLIAGGIMVFYLNVPGRLFGIGQYGVTVNLPGAAGLYNNANVTYRGTEVGRVREIRLTPSGVDALLSLSSDTKIPADLDAHVHSQTAVGEQFVELVPRTGGGPDLKNGDVIALDRTTVPPDIGSLLAATRAGLAAIPHDNLRTAIDEAFTGVGGLGPELARIVDGTTTLARDARENLTELTTVIDKSNPVLKSQSDTSEAIDAWASNIADVAKQVQAQDDSVRGILADGPAAADEARQLIDEVRPTLPVVMANLVSLADVAVTYNASLEQILVLAPPAVEAMQGSHMANRDTKQAYKGEYLSFNLNLNLPPACTTGYLPAQQIRPPSEVDYPDRPEGTMYCRVPQDAQQAVRGARNLPCITRPGKRAPTVKMCESDEVYVPLNDGYNWKGDPNATMSGQAVPQLPPGTPPRPVPTAPPPPLASATYDPASGTYIGPDGKQYTQSNLAADGSQPQSLEDLMVPSPEGP